MHQPNTVIFAQADIYELERKHGLVGEVSIEHKDSNGHKVSTYLPAPNLMDVDMGLSVCLRTQTQV